MNNFIAGSADYGAWQQRFDGLDVTINVRAGGFTFAGGTSTGQTVADNCGVRARLPESRRRRPERARSAPAW